MWHSLNKERYENSFMHGDETYLHCLSQKQSHETPVKTSLSTRDHFEKKQTN